MWKNAWRRSKEYSRSGSLSELLHAIPDEGMACNSDFRYINGIQSLSFLLLDNNCIIVYNCTGIIWKRTKEFDVMSFFAESPFWNNDWFVRTGGNDGRVSGEFAEG